MNVEMRDITDEELELYERDGWVMLRELIPRSLAAELLDAAKDLMERSRAAAPDAVLDWVPTFTDNFGFQARKIRVDPFYAFTFSKAVGRTAQRLMNRRRLTDEPVAVRYCEDALLYK